MTSKSPRARALWPRGDNFTEFISPPRRCAENNKICVGIRPVFYKSVKCNFNWEGARTFSEHKNILNLSNAENFDYFRSDLATFLALSFTTSTSHWILFHANFFFRKAFSLYSTSTSFSALDGQKKAFDANTCSLSGGPNKSGWGNWEIAWNFSSCSSVTPNSTICFPSRWIVYACTYT